MGKSVWHVKLIKTNTYIAWKNTICNEMAYTKDFYRNLVNKSD